MFDTGQSSNAAIMKDATDFLRKEDFVDSTVQRNQSATMKDVPAMSRRKEDSVFGMEWRKNETYAIMKDVIPSTTMPITHHLPQSLAQLEEQRKMPARSIQVFVRAAKRCGQIIFLSIMILLPPLITSQRLMGGVFWSMIRQWWVGNI